MHLLSDLRLFRWRSVLAHPSEGIPRMGFVLHGVASTWQGKVLRRQVVALFARQSATGLASGAIQARFGVAAVHLDIPLVPSPSRLLRVNHGLAHRDGGHVLAGNLCPRHVPHLGLRRQLRKLHEPSPVVAGQVLRDAKQAGNRRHVGRRRRDIDLQPLGVVRG